MTSTLHCKILPSEGISSVIDAVFDSSGHLVFADTTPGFKLPDRFSVEVEEGVVFSIKKKASGHIVDDDDMDAFVAMVFG